MATVGPEPELPPLTVEETERIIGRIASVVEEHHLVLIGGQAVALWRAQLAAYVPAGAYTVTSRDVDLQGSRRALDSIAELLDGRLRVPSFDDHTPLVGVVLRSRVANSALPASKPNARRSSLRRQSHSCPPTAGCCSTTTLTLGSSRT